MAVLLSTPYEAQSYSVVHHHDAPALLTLGQHLQACTTAKGASHSQHRSSSTLVQQSEQSLRFCVCCSTQQQHTSTPTHACDPLPPHTDYTTLTWHCHLHDAAPVHHRPPPAPLVSVCVGVAHVMQHQPLPPIEAEPEVPLLPADVPAVNSEAGALQWVVARVVGL